MRLLSVLPLVLLLALLPVSSAQDVTSEHFGTGESFSHTFAGEGKARFHCHPHPGMGFGDIVVGPASEGGPQTHVVEIARDGDGFAFSAAELTIGAGDTVEWRSVEGTHQIMIWEGATAAHHDEHDHDHAHDQGDAAAESPAVAFGLPLALALAFVALRRR